MRKFEAKGNTIEAINEEQAADKMDVALWEVREHFSTYGNLLADYQSALARIGETPQIQLHTPCYLNSMEAKRPYTLEIGIRGKRVYFWNEAQVNEMYNKLKSL